MNKIKYKIADDIMFIFRRIIENDVDLEFITGNKAFDEKNPEGKLKIYLDEDLKGGGEFCTYLLLEKIDSDKVLVLGLLRYKISNKKEFFSELMNYDIDLEIRNKLNKELDTFNFKFIYLSRIGVLNKYQDMNVGQIISNFFEFLIKKDRKNCFIYLKVVEKQKDFIAPSYEFIAQGEDKKWGNYYMASKFLEFD